MVKVVELEKGVVVNIKGESFLILNTETEIEWEDEIYTMDLTVKKISCPHCNGNLEKLGRVNGQYKCLKCNKLIVLNELGELGNDC